MPEIKANGNTLAVTHLTSHYIVQWKLVNMSGNGQLNDGNKSYRAHESCEFVSTITNPTPTEPTNIAQLSWSHL